MSRNFYKCILLLLISVSYSCGPKKGIVTKKKNQKKTTEVVITESSPEVEAVSKAQEKDQPTETPIRSKTPSGSGSSVDIYIADFAEISKVEMQKYKIPASITLAQGILESGAGKGRLAREANNHFGIKCHDWTGDRIYHDDDRSGECFRKYRNPEESYEDHSKFLTQRRRYAPLFELRQDDYKGWARGLKKAGYATDRNYPKKLIGLIERYELHKYDDEVLNGRRKSRRKQRSVELVEPKEVYETYIVQQGDTLYSLSRKFGVTVEELKSMNNLKNNTINIGQPLKVRKK